MSEFVATKNVSGFLEIDENRKEWRIPEKELYKLSFTEQMSTKRFMNSVRSVFKKREEHIYSFSDILDVEILENGSANEIASLSVLSMLMLSKALFSYVPKVVDENNIEEISMNEDKSVFIKYKDGTIEMIDNPLNIEDLKIYVS